MGKTELGFNIIGHRLDDDPVPIIYVAPTQKLVESISKDRIMKMFRNCPSLWRKLLKGKSEKITEKFVGGVRLGFAWASSAVELSSHPAGLIIVDERDRMDDLAGEGDPVVLAEARTVTYPNGLVMVVSTPTVEGASPVWSLFQEGTQHKWAIPCPSCGEYFVPSFSVLKWPAKSTPIQAAKSAYLECPACQAHINDEQKYHLNKQGKYSTSH